MKVHLISNSLFMNSGYSNVAKYLGIGLKKLGYDVTMTGMQHAYCIDRSDVIPQYPIQVDNMDETGQIVTNIMDIKPDVVICIFQSDEPSLNHIPKLAHAIDKKIKTIWYTTIEGSRVPEYSMNDFMDVIKNGGKIVVPSEFGADEINKEWLHQFGGDIVAAGDVKVIPYGYNNKAFFETKGPELSGLVPLAFDEKGLYLKFNNGTKKWDQYSIEIFKDLKAEFRGKFIFGQIAQNFGVRKRFERLLKAYSILISKTKMLKDRTILHLHTFPVSAKGINLVDEVNRLGIQENVTFSYGKYLSSGWSEEGLCILMNMLDCHVSSSSGEGYSMPCAETMACGVPNIAPNFTSFPELIGDHDTDDKARGLLAELDTIQMTQTTSYKGLVSEEDLALKMHVMYVKKEDREIFSKNGIKFMKDRTWDSVVSQWDKLLQSMK